MSDLHNISNRGGICRKRVPITSLGTPLPMCLHEPPNQSSVFARQNPALDQIAKEPTYSSNSSSQSESDQWSALESGTAALVGSGQLAVTRVPIPGTQNLFLELKPQGYVPPSGSTSSIFLQSPDGKNHLRLDYGYNKATGKVDYHWNQKGTFSQFGIKDHTPVSSQSQAAIAHKGAKFFRFAGKAFVVVGAAADVYSVVVAKKKLRQTARVLSGWGGAWAGCKLVGAGGAAGGGALGSAAGGIGAAPGSAIGGAVGCSIGGVGGYFSFSWAAGEAYDWIEETYFEEVPETKESSQGPQTNSSTPTTKP